MTYFSEEKESCLGVYFWYRRELNSEKGGDDYHIHDGRYELMYIEDGEALLQLKQADGSTKEAKVSAGQFAFISSGIEHRTYIRQGETVKICNVEFTAVKPESEVDKRFILNNLFESSNEAKKVLGEKRDYFIATDTESVLESILCLHLDLDEYFYRSKDENEYMVQLLINRTLISISRCVANEFTQKSSGYVNKIITFTNKFYSQDISISKIAERVGVHPTYANRVFKQFTGKSILEYVTGLRIKKAKKLLMTTNYPIIDVAVETGYNNRQQFHNIFKKKVGMTPNEFRKRYKK